VGLTGVVAQRCVAGAGWVRVVPGIASDQFCLGAGGREHSALVSEEGGTCVCLAVGFGCRVSSCGAVLAQVGARAGPGSTRQEGFNWGHGSVLWGSGLKLCVGPGHHFHFYPDPDEEVFRSAVLTRPRPALYQITAVLF